MVQPIKYQKTKRLLAIIAPFAWLALLAFAVWSLGKEWGGFHLGDLDKALRRIGVWHIAIALVLTAASLLCNASLDLVALRWLQRDLPPGKVLGTALIAASFSMNGGGTILGGGAIRLRFYAQYGIGGVEVAKITGFLMVAGLLGHALLAGVMMCLSPPELSWLSTAMGRGLGLAALVGCAAVCALSATGFRGKPIPFLPPWRILVAAMVISGIDWLLAGLALRVFLPAEVPTAAFLAATAVGQALGAASHVPGGVGVMELFITKFSVGMVEPAMMVGALMTYRLTYYLIPFMIAVAAVGCREIWAKRHWAQMTVDGSSRAWSAIAPRLAGMSALAGGFVLMFSATSPMDPARRLLLEKFVPLPFVETSHFLSSIAGTVMIIVASGLLRRVQVAWWIAVMMAAGGIVFSLVKGLDWEEAVVLLVFLGALLPFRSKFHRHAGIWSRRFSSQWWGLILSIVGLAVWFGFYASREVSFSSDLWWQFSFDNDDARLLRGMAGSMAILVFVALLQYFRPAPSRLREPQPDMDRVQEMIANNSRASSALALVGDKEFLFNFEQSAFLMYADHARTRVAMADPVGDEEKFEGLYWRFMEQAHDEGMKIAFYQVGAAMIPVCVEMGLRIHKLGEQAMVPLDSFDLSSPELVKFREAMLQMERGGWQFEIWQPAEVATRLDELRVVSDAWLAHHEAREKGFSLGRFDAAYLSRLPIAVILIDGRVTAFGTIWPGNGKDELSTDLMRQTPDAPNGVLDCLLVNVMLWGKQQGYKCFDLGVAPLAGMFDNPFTPLWSGIDGQRPWMSEFHPVWLPRYLAISNALDLPSAIQDITALIEKPPAIISKLP